MIDVDIHIVMGQSNMVSSGGLGAVTLPALAAGESFDSLMDVSGTINTGFRDIFDNDRVSGSGPSAPWRTFARTWFDLTGRGTMWICVPEGGTALVAAADTGPGYWDAASGAGLYQTKRPDILAAIHNLTTLSPGARIVGRYLHWGQGENDASNGAVTESAYEAALDNLRAQAIYDFGLNMFCIHELGYRASDPSNTAWDGIRAAQNTVAGNAGAAMIWNKANERTALVVNGAGAWVSGSGYSDDVHYSPENNKAWGIGAATNLAGLI